MSDTQDMTPSEGNAELNISSAADAFLGLMGGDDDPEGQPELQAEANDSEDDSEQSDEEQVEGDEEVEQPTYRVKAAGEEREVTLDELIKSYQLGTDYTRKSQAVAEDRKIVEAERHAINEAKALRDQYAQRLEMMEQMLRPQEDTENLAYLRETDPIGYSVKVADMVERDKQVNAVRAERERISQQQEYERGQHLQRTIAEESQKLVDAVPDFADPVKRDSLRKNIREFGKQLGWSDQELASVYDSRAVLTLYKAMQYDKLVASKPEINKKVSQAPKVMKSGVSMPRDSNSEELKKLKVRAKQSGRVADAASVFERFI